MTKKKHIAIIGGGIAGLEAGSVLTRQGYKVTIIEKENKTGGLLNHWSSLFPDFSLPGEVLARIQPENPDLTLIHNTCIESIKKENGRFELFDKRHLKLYADALLLATGLSVFDASLKEEYGYGLFINVITSSDFERIHKAGQKLLTAQGDPPKRVAIIHCVGSRDAKVGNGYCSKVCCITGVKRNNFV